METITRKQHLLEEAGYAFSFSHEIYLNRKSRKVFSLEFIEDNPETEIESRLAEPEPPQGEWKYYFVNGPSDAVRRELSKL